MYNNKVAEDLFHFLSDSYVLYLKTQNFHWNIKGPNFFSLHVLFQKQYEDLAMAVDDLAERIRGLREKVPGTMKEFLEHSTLKEAEENLDAKKMLEILTSDHEKIINSLHEKIKRATDQGDEGTADLYIERLRVHEKTAWILRSHLEG